LRRHGIATSHRARQVEVADFTRFDLILAMDRQNLRDLERLRPHDATAQLRLLDAAEVPDPYYDGPEAFAAIFTQIDDACRRLIAEASP
jgi:protein-tyrosine-phosphatase